MTIGVFDSGLGGLVVTHHLIKELPEYDYLYLGDTAHVPYGDRDQATIRNYTTKGVDYLLDRGCALVIVACNTASAEALRHIQQQYLPAHYPDRRVLGVLIPASEEAVSTSRNQNIGVIATKSTVDSGAYVREILKARPSATVTQQAAPLLVPLLEAGNLATANLLLQEYLDPFLNSAVDTLILGCTHYSLLKDRAQILLGGSVRVISPNDYTAPKLRDYLNRHPEIEERLGKRHEHTFCVTELSSEREQVAQQLFGEKVPLREVVI